MRKATTKRGFPGVAALMVAVWLSLPQAAALAQAVAMVTDLSGRVSGPGTVTITAELAADAQVEVATGGRLVVIYLKSGDEYAFAGPSRVRFGVSGPQVLSGAQPQKRGSPLAQAGGVTIKPVAVQQAAVVMRSARPTARIRLLSLSGTKTLEPAPEFRWQELEPALTYRFELIDDTGKSIHEAEVKGGAHRLPDSVRLREGVAYTWEISARTQDGRRYMSAGEFSVGDAALRAQAAALRPAAGTSVSDRVAYAAWLDQMELKDEARRYWRDLSAERPEDARLKALAGR